MATQEQYVALELLSLLRLAKLDRLRSDYLRLAEWAEEQRPHNRFAGQVAQYARARLAEWDQPLEEWEP